MTDNRSDIIHLTVGPSCLIPIRAPSREEVRASVKEFNSKKKGEVIFDVRTTKFREYPKFKRRIVSLITIFLPSKLANI
jgi:hypothetical protein